MAVGSLIRDWIKSEIETVPGYGTVHKTLREIRNADQFLADFGTGQTSDDGFQTAKGWTIQLVSRPTEEQMAGGGGIDTYTARLRCFWSVYDRGDSEIAFVEHVEAVADALSDEAEPAALLLTVPDLHTVEPAQIEELAYVEFGTRLAHRATVTLPVIVSIKKR